MVTEPATGGPAAQLRTVIESASRWAQVGPAPQFSDDGGVTVSDAAGRSARVQPLGQRARISVGGRGRDVAEGEVDLATLITEIGAAGDTYECVTAALERENGAGRR